MKTSLLTTALLLSLSTPIARADFVTAHGTIGMLEMQLVTKTLEPVGTVQLWNRGTDLNMIVTPAAGRCLLSRVYVYLDSEPAPPLPVLDDLLKLVPIPTLPNGSPLPLRSDGTIDSSQLDELTIDALMQLLIVEANFGKWPYTAKYKTPTALPYILNVPLSDVPGLQWGNWGESWLLKRLVTVAVRVELKTLDRVPVTFAAWAVNPNVPLDVQRTAWGDNAFAPRYELQHPMRGTFAGPVHGLSYSTPTHAGIIGSEGGGFSFYPGEDITLKIAGVYIGKAKADQQISPLDVFPSLETSDPAVINFTRLLLSLDADGNSNGSIDLTTTAALLPKAMGKLVPAIAALDFGNTAQMDLVIAKVVALGRAGGSPLVNVSAAAAVDWLEDAVGARLLRRNVSKSPQYAVDKPKLDIMPLWVPAKTANGLATTVECRDADGNLLEVRDKAKPLFVTYTEEQGPNMAMGITRRGSDIITAVSMDDGATWKRFNVSHMAGRSSFTIKATGERFPGDSRSPQQKIAENKILVVWSSAYARGGKPSFAIRTDDAYPGDDAYAVNDIWGVRGKQGSVDYNLDKDVGDQGIRVIPYYAMWACRGVVVSESDRLAGKFLDKPVGELVWFKPERLTSARRDAFIPVVGSAKNVGFGIAWQEDPGGLRPGNCMAGGEGWSGATVNKKTDIWYSFIRWADFDKVDVNFVPTDMAHDDLGEEAEAHGLQPEIASRPKWLVPTSLPVRISDNNTVNTDNLKVQLDPATGLPIIDPVTGFYIPLLGAEAADYVAHEHEGCDAATLEATEEVDGEHDGETGTGGGWGMARYAYMLPQLGLANLSGSTAVWDGTTLGEYRPTAGIRWYRFVNQPGVVKTVAVTADGRVLDGDTSACRPNLTLMPGGWAILGYEETKGLGTPSEEENEEVHTVVTNGSDAEDDEAGEKGKDIVYHSFKFDSPEMVSAGNVLNLPALDDAGNLIPVYYKDAAGLPTEYVRQYATENARRVHFLAQNKSEMGSTRTAMVAIYKQGREGNGKPSDVFMIRAVVPTSDTSTDNPYRFSNFARYDTGAQATDLTVMKSSRKHLNMTSATVEAFDPLDIAGDGEGHEWAKVARWSQSAGNIKDESFANPYSDAKGHRGFIRGDLVVLGYSFTPNWGRLGGDHMDFYVRRSFDGGKNWTTNPNATETVHTVIEKDPVTREYVQKQYRYGPGAAEPGRNVSLLKGNKYTVTDPRLVPPMGPGTVNPTYPTDDTYDPNVYYVAFGTAEVLHGLGEPLGETDTIKADVFYTRTTDSGTTWLEVPWVINPESASPDAGETVYRFPWLAQDSPHQGHAQLRMHPSGTRLYAIWHQWTDGDDLHVSPHDVGNDIWFRRIDFMGE